MGRSVDRAVRASWLGRRSNWLRKASPRTYSALRGLYQRALGRRKGALSPYQAAAIDEFLLTTPAGILARGVLEIGSDLDGLVLRELLRRGVPRVVGINPAFDTEAATAATATLPSGGSLRSVDLRGSGFDAGSFGAIFSVAVFEHLNAFDECLAEMHRILVPGGHVYAAFGPIWSSSLGHHVFAEADGVQLRHWDPARNPIGDHDHLLLDAAALRAEIARTRSTALAEAAVAWVYQERGINRLFYDDYVAAFERSPFRVVRLTPEREHVPADRLARLRREHPAQSTFDVRNAEVILERAT